MGLLWRLFAPKPLKKARRTVRKTAHPVRTATRAVTPKPVKQLQRAAHPVSLAELKIEDAGSERTPRTAPTQAVPPYSAAVHGNPATFEKKPGRAGKTCDSPQG